MPLVLANVGEPQIVKRIGGNPETKRHLEDLGFTVGGEVCIVTTLGGNVIVKVKESRVAVSDELARRIMFDHALTDKDTRPCESTLRKEKENIK